MLIVLSLTSNPRRTFSVLPSVGIFIDTAISLLLFDTRYPDGSLLLSVLLYVDIKTSQSVFNFDVFSIIGMKLTNKIKNQLKAEITKNQFGRREKCQELLSRLDRPPVERSP
jgi:hypothetical protein